MTKKEKIQEAYGEHWEYGKDEVDENGWFGINSSKYVSLFHKVCRTIRLDSKKEDDLWYYRPSSLSGIEDNNGWIKIESEADLPKNEEGFYFYQKSDWSIKAKPCTLKTLRNIFNYLKGTNTPLTHYKEIPLEIQKPPIY